MGDGRTGAAALSLASPIRRVPAADPVPNPMSNLAKWLGCALIAILGLLSLQIEPQRTAEASSPAQRAHAGVAAAHAQP